MSHDMRILVYPNSPSDDTLAESTASVLESTIDSVVATTSVGSGYADVDYRHPGVDDSSRSEFYSAWRTYVRQSIDDASYGCHLCLSGNVDGGRAAGGSGYEDFDDAFVSKSWAVAGGDADSAHSRNIRIMEALHPFVDAAASRFDQPWDDEHTLGGIDPSGDVTPMATGYADSAATAGRCSGSDWDGGYTTSLSNCVLRGIDATYRSGFNEGASTDGTWFEAREIAVDDPWNTYAIGPSLPYPVVFATPLSYVGPEPAHTRVRNALPARDTDGFDCRVEEWEYLNGPHYEERAGCLVINTGHVRNDDHSRFVQTGIVGGVDENFDLVSYHGEFVGTPVVITQAQTTTGGQAIVTRVRNVGSATFEVRVQEEEALGGHRDESIAWLATPPGEGHVDGQQYEAGRVSGVTDDWTYVDFANSYADPVFLADMQTFDGANPAGLRRRDLSSDGVYVKVEEEQSATAETNHVNPETVGYVVIES